MRGTRGHPTHVAIIRAIEDAARPLQLQVQVAEANRPADFEEAFAALAKTRTGALLVTSGATTNAHRNQIIALAAKSRVVALYAHRGLVEAGGLMSYGAAKPSDVPVQQPTQFELVINLKTAKAVGLTIPQSLLQRADQVIE